MTFSWIGDLTPGNEEVQAMAEGTVAQDEGVEDPAKARRKLARAHEDLASSGFQATDLEKLRE